jgi:hypothetical protein
MRAQTESAIPTHADATSSVGQPVSRIRLTRFTV